MKVTNWYTISLVIIACTAFLFSMSELVITNIYVFFVMIGLIIILEIFPIQLPSGDQYAAGSLGYLFLLIHEGFSYATIAIFIAAFAYYMKSFRVRRIPLIRLFVTIGMYVVSVFASLIVWNLTYPFNVFLAVGMVSIVFEIVNFVLFEGIQAAVFKNKMFTNIKQKVVELIIPVMVCIIVISRLILIKSDTELIITMLYTFFFLLIVIFFSHEFMKQLALRQSTTKAFIQVLEGRITPSLAGHGNRVGIICDTLLEDLSYPKRKRHDLVQAAIIHDIGKALIPSYIFRKRGDLTLSEEREYKNHPENAVEIVKTMFSKESFFNWILYHHERWDGRGFPKGLQGEDIPLGSRIIALANELDHIISRHDDHETILKLLKEKSGTMLDPKLVEKVELHHIEMLLDGFQILPSQEELPKTSAITESQYSINNSYSSIGKSFFIHIKNGQIISPKNDIPDDFVHSLANMAIVRQEAVHETYSHSNLTLDLHAQSLPNGDVTIFAHDLTPYINHRQQLENNILESYVQVINTLSEGKITLHSSKANLEEKLGEWIADIQINSHSDVPISRELTKRVLEKYPTELKSMQVQVAVSEAVTNILKHATAGKLSIYRQENTLQFFISDKGSGIPLHEIPKTILVSGYSSKRSLGHGFKLIAKFSDSVQIYTSSEGTYILMEYRQQEEKEGE